jgi:hypothetical protein
MTDARYVVAGLARPRAAWFNDLSRWANAGTVPAEFIKCVGQADLLSRTGSGRPFSAVVIDGGLPGIDRDFISKAGANGATVVVVEDVRVHTNWLDAGADVVLPTDFGPGNLIEALSSSSRLISRVEASDLIDVHDPTASPLRGHVVTVVGSGGVGVSTVAMAVAQAGGQSPAFSRVLLADFCLSAELAMLHDTQAVSPGLQEVVEAHRTKTLDPEQLRALCFHVDGRGYDLLLGLRRRRFWTAIRPSALASAFTATTASFDLVVVDTDAELEGEAETGSVDIEERNVLARTAIRNADTVLTVGHASLKGLHALTRVISDLREFAVVDAMIQPVINFAPGNAKARAAYTKALRELLDTDSSLATPIFVPFQQIDEAVRANSPLPASAVDPFRAYLEHRARTVLGYQPEPRGWERMRAGFLRNQPTQATTS